jgi:hypothetical protein
MQESEGLGAQLKDPAYRRLFQQERLILEVTESICEVMEKTSTSRSVLARLLGRTKGHITQLLSGRRNLTLRTWADMMTALGHQATVSYAPLTSEANVHYSIPTTPEVEVVAHWDIAPTIELRMLPPPPEENRFAA